MSDPRINQGPKTVAVGDKGMVSTQLQSSTEAALKVLKDGGNAVDAALTALFVQEVADYQRLRDQLPLGMFFALLAGLGITRRRKACS